MWVDNGFNFVTLAPFNAILLKRKYFDKLTSQNALLKYLK